jgi:two-component sensor histidine kinase
MDMRLKLFLRQLGWSTLIGMVSGLAVGYATRDYLDYPTALGMCLGCAYTIQIFQALTEVYIYPRFEGFSRGKRLYLQQASSLLAHILGWLIPVWIVGMVIGFGLPELAVLIWLGIFIAFVLIIHLVHQSVSFYRELREKDVLEERLKTLATQAELKALRAQISPHFLFNSLNTIASLISTKPQKAEESIERLADIFRYALSASDREFVTLRDELEFIDSYLEIQKARFGDRLVIAKSISPEILDIPIPSLILQPLVENSIKHGQVQTGEMRIEIIGYMDGDLVKVEIKDEGKGAPEEVRAGIYTTNGTGLRNVNERLQKIYGESYGLKIKENEPNGTLVVVTIPKGKDEA